MCDTGDHCRPHTDISGDEFVKAVFDWALTNRRTEGWTDGRIDGLMD